MCEILANKNPGCVSGLCLEISGKKKRQQLQIREKIYLESIGYMSDLEKNEFSFSPALREI